MLIVSKFKDYYDTAIGYGGIDKNIVYKRITFDIENPKEYSNFYNKYFKFFENNIFKDDYFSYRLGIGMTFFSFNIYFNIILFCGEIYPFIELYYRDTKKQKSYSGYFFSFNAIENIIKKKFHKELKNNKWDKKSKYFLKNLNNFFITSKNINKLKVFDYHRDVDSPIILYKMNEKRVIINPVLSDYNFYKIYDSFQTYQKIEMFLSGVMGTGEKEIIEVDDKSLRDKKGFNSMSFKKEKEK
jgi:hypothetical protein